MACAHDNGCIVAHGVDEFGEWESYECFDCGVTWLERERTGATAPKGRRHKEEGATRRKERIMDGT